MRVLRPIRSAVVTSPRAHWLAVLVTTAAVYLFTAHWQSGQVSDAVAASWPGWSLVHHGSLFLDHAPYPHSNFAIYPINGHLVASRTTGVVLAGIPVQLLLGWTGITPEQGGALTAALMTAVAMANVSLIFREILPLRRALAATATVAFGTTAWTVASAELWTHGPDLLWLTTGILAATRGRHWIAGAAFGAAFLTRPHLALIALVIGIGATFDTRRLRTLVAYAVPAGVAVLFQLVWTGWYYGDPTLLGVYDNHVLLLDEGPGLAYNLMGALISPGCGLLLFTPVALVAAATIPWGWAAAPAWVRRAAVGGVLYVLLQMKLNHFNGGGGFYGYRLVLEGVVVVAPLGAFCWNRAAAERRWVQLAGIISASASIGLIGFGALLAPYWRGGTGDWDAWYPWVVVKASGIAAVPALLIMAAGIGLGLQLLRPSGSREPQQAPTRHETSYLA